MLNAYDDEMGNGGIIPLGAETWTCFLPSSARAKNVPNPRRVVCRILYLASIVAQNKALSNQSWLQSMSVV